MLKVYRSPAVAALAPFTFTVPGQYVWRILAVHATLTRGNLAANTRTLTVALSDGTTTILRAPYLDPSTGTSDLDITWSAAAAVASTAAANPYVNVPLPQFTLASGYVITGAITNGHASDQWTSPAVWVDELVSV